MKRVIRFSRFFVPAFILSGVLILISVFGYVGKGFNLGVDFQAGINQTVQLALPVGSVGYSGKGNAELRITDEALTLVFSGAEIDQRTVVLNYQDYGTIKDLAQALSAEAGVEVSIDATQETSNSALLLPTSQGNTLISQNAVKLHRAVSGEGEYFATIDQVRAAITDLGKVSVQTLKPESSQRYLIRIEDSGEDPNFSATARQSLVAGLESAFGKDRVVVLKTDFVGARYSQGLSRTSLMLVGATLVLIFLYSLIRFKSGYALGAVLAIAQDAIVMVGFIVWTRMEFSSMTIAAILTILGYSVNDTIVQFDRIREQRKLRPNDKFIDIIDSALTMTLGRTIITTVTTMLAVLALFFFTTGSMKDFALALFVGMTAGTYSTIFIASGFVAWWYSRDRKKKQPKTAEAAQPAGSAS
ncbi:MAG: protein translocase subunit SecF [Spirochaetia bacterium]|jgi:preprotein translocase subunit SecF|nr:protein translocase subunit SecF [Spirochaetales bacterium]MDX9783823.1 protein translocase subunit SecF [Spirochaetia bacterium]